MTNEVKKDVELTNEDHRPVQSFNTGKKGEFAERVCFTEKRAAEHDCKCRKAE